VRQVCYLLEE